MVVTVTNLKGVSKVVAIGALLTTMHSQMDMERRNHESGAAGGIVNARGSNVNIPFLKRHHNRWRLL